MRSSSALLLAGLFLVLALVQASTIRHEHHYISRTPRELDSEYFSSGEYSQQENNQAPTQAVRHVGLFDKELEEHCFDYNSQIASGIASSNQKAITRFEARACISVVAPFQAVLRLHNTRFAQREAEEVMDSTQMRPMNAFGPVHIGDSEMRQDIREKLALPVVVEFVEGVVKRLYFDKQDEPWSKNIKKAVLNLVQMTSKPQQSSSKQPFKGYPQQFQRHESYRVMETSIEGNCPTTYKVLSSTPAGKYSAAEINVSKSLDFEHCEQVADIGYGFQMDSVPLHTRQNTKEDPRATRLIPEERLKRSTTTRYVLVNKEKERNAYKLNRVEMISEYTFKNTETDSEQGMHTTVFSTLVLTNSQPSNEEEVPAACSETDSLLYDAEEERAEKIFYMFGDEDRTVSQKVHAMRRRNSDSIVEEAIKHLDNMAQTFSASEGIEVDEAKEHFNELVKTLRWCSEKELRTIDSRTQDNIKDELFTSALAAAATRNTIYVLTKKVEQDAGNAQSDNDVDKVKWSNALRALGTGAGLPAISHSQVNAVLTLCKSDAVRRAKTSMLRQSCWLTFGTMAKELARQSQKTQRRENKESPLKTQESTERHQFQLYEEVLQQQLKNAGSDMYEQMLALKAIGNAGLQGTLSALKGMAEDHSQSALVRTMAIDAMRRFQNEKSLPSVHRTLLRIYQDMQEPLQIRSVAFALLLKSMPKKKEVSNELINTIINEQSAEMQTYVQQVVKMWLKAPSAEVRKCVQPLQKALKKSKVQQSFDDSKEYASRTSRASTVLYSPEDDEGMLLKYVSMWGNDGDHSRLPSHMTLGFDTHILGQYQKSAFLLSMCQKDWQKVIEHFFQIPSSGQDDPQDQSEQSSNTENHGIFASATRKLRNIAERLGVAGRSSYLPNSAKSTPAHLMFSIRVNDVDLAVWPVGMGSDRDSDSSISQMARSLRQWFSRGHQAQLQIDFSGVSVFGYRAVAVPTSVGMPLRGCKHSVLVTRIRAQAEAQDGYKFKLHPDVSLIGSQKMEVCTAAGVACSGVKNSRSVSLNLPLEMRIQKSSAGESKEYKISARLPRQPVRVLTAQSLPVTFTRQLQSSTTDNESNKYSMINTNKMRVKTIRSSEQENERQVEDYSLCDKQQKGQVCLPVHIYGDYQVPRAYSLKELARVASGAENYFAVVVDTARYNTPDEIVARVKIDDFRKSFSSPASSMAQKITDFFGKRFQRDEKNQEQHKTEENKEDSDEDIFSSSDMKQWMMKEHKQHRNQKINKHLEQFARTQKHNYEHSLDVEIETVKEGSKPNKLAELQLDAVCEARLRACQAKTLMAYPPTGWQFKSNIQTLYPEHVEHVSELFQDQDQDISEKHQFYVHCDAEWGTKDAKESMQINMQGRPSARLTAMAKRKMEREQQVQQGKNIYGNRAISYQRLQPFIDEYEVVAECSLKPQTTYKLQQHLGQLKAAYFWNTYSRSNTHHLHMQPAGNSKEMNTFNTDMLVRVDPWGSGKANLTIRTSNEHIFVRDIEMPLSARPMCLVHGSDSKPALHSSSHAVANWLIQGERPQRRQCKVSSNQVNTFDGASFKAPLSKCYTVLAKDCAGGEQPRFVVLMKSTEMGSDKKKIKVIVPNKEITVEAMNNNNNQLQIKVNDRAYTINSDAESDVQTDRKLQQHGIHVQTDYTGRQVANIELNTLSVKFDGRTAKINLDDEYKQMQCGICGHYDDNTVDELRKNDNKLTNDLKDFHRSYSLQEDEECGQEEHRQFYDDKKRHHFEFKPNKKQKHANLEQRTVIDEHNHKICFSRQPVRQCPEGTYASEQSEQPEKVQFTCMNRNSVDARRLRAQIREVGVADLSDYSMSSVNEVVVPQICVRA